MSQPLPAPVISESGRPGWATLAPLMDLVMPMALRVAATLRLADLLDTDTAGTDAADTDGVHIDELAARSHSNPDGLARMLRHLVTHGVFTEPAPDRFATNETARLLRSDHPDGLRNWLDLDGFGSRMDLAFTGLPHTVRTGEPAWQTVFGHLFWDHLAADRRLAASFDATMAAETGPEQVTDAASGYDWAAVSHLVDVGGGTGALVAAALHASPRLRATLVDLPDTVNRARAELTARGLASRCAFSGQSFFDPLPTGGDVYLLRHILHDWPDEQAVTILRRCADAAGPHGQVVIIEHFGASDDDPAAFAEMNLRMLVLAGGKERTVDAHRALATAAGLTLTEHHTTPRRHVVMVCSQNPYVVAPGPSTDTTASGETAMEHVAQTSSAAT